MKKKSAASHETHPKILTRSNWQLPDTEKLKLQYTYANSILAEFVSGHEHADVLRELVQNEYDAGGSRLKVAFGTNELRITGNGKPIDSDGWKRLSVMLGTGQVGGSAQNIAHKVNGIGSKNFGLRSLFLYGDKIYIRSGGLNTVLDYLRGTLQDPILEPDSKGLLGIEIVVPYRTRKSGELEPFDVVRETQALESFATGLGPTLMKLAQPQTPKSLRQVEISSVRCNRSLVLNQSVKFISQYKGITVVRRTVHMTDSNTSNSQATQEIEFQRVISLPQQYRDQTIPGYFKVPGGRIRLAVSLRKSRNKIDLKQPGNFFYPLAATKAYTGNAISINAPFQMIMDRSQIIDPNNNKFNDLLIDRAADLTFDLLASDRWNTFGADFYIALQEQTPSTTTYFLDRVINRLKKNACWPTRAREKVSSNLPQLTTATNIVVPKYPVLDGFLSASSYLDDALGNDPRIQTMVKKYGAKAFSVNSLVRLRCAGLNETNLATRLDSDEANYYFEGFPDELKEVNLQQKFANAFDVLASRLSKQNREDLQKSPTTLAADGSLQAPEDLWVVDPTIASVCPIPASQLLHPTLTGFNILVRLCNKYDAKKWVQKTAQQVQDGTASEEQRIALYNFVLRVHGHLDRKTWAILRKTQILRDHRNVWVTPKSITLRNAVGAPQMEAALHFPHPDYENDKELTKAFRFNKKVTGEDIVSYAHIVEYLPDLAPEFEETLQRFSQSLKKQELESLKTIAFLMSSRGRLGSPSGLYLNTSRNRDCLGDDAAFVIGSRTELYKRLGCMEGPKAEDILTNLKKLRRQGVKPKWPEILYPALVEALKAGKNNSVYQRDQPIIWDGAGYSKPMDMLLSRKYRQTFLQVVPLVEEASPKLRQALESLGVPPEPQPQHWQKLFVWFDQQYGWSRKPLPQLERIALLKAYSQLEKWPWGVADDKKCLLGQDGRLHSLAEMRAKQFLQNDDPILAEALIANEASFAFADMDISGSQELGVSKFYRKLGISLLTEVREQKRLSIGAEKTPPPWFNSIKVIENLHTPSFLSACSSLSAHQPQDSWDPDPPTPDSAIPQLQAVQSLFFTQSIQIEYCVGSDIACVSTDVQLDRERFVLTEPLNENELHELLSQAIASLFFSRPAEQHVFADAVYRVLTCSSDPEITNYLKRHGISWKPPASIPEAEDTHLDDEDPDKLTSTQIDPEVADATLNGKANRDYQVVQEVIKSSMMDRLRTSVTTSNTTFSLIPKEGNNTSTKFSSEEAPLPPIESVTPVPLEPLDSWSPSDSSSSRAGRGGSWTPSTSSINEDRNREVGHRGEEIIYLQEVGRVKRLGYPESQVVWKSKENPSADIDILSVDENGRDLWLEVKSTTGQHGHFQWSIAELAKAIQEREQYILWRVYEVGTTHPSIKPFRDPVGMILHHGMQLNIASLSAEVEPLRVPD